MDIYCVTHKKMDFIEELKLIPVAVGKTECPKHYVNEKAGINISYKNLNYGELTFHYWFWKNKLKNYSKNEWFAICHYRRFFLKDKIDMSMNIEIELNTLKSKLIYQPLDNWKDCDVVLCEPTNLGNQKKMKLIKRGFKSLIKNPLIFFDKKKHNIKLHFDMNHGYGNLEKAANLLPEKDKKDFMAYVSSKTWLIGHCIFISKNKKLMDKFYSNLFSWLSECEKIFGFDSNSYDTKRIYSFLTERYMPFWFEKYSKVLTWPWVYFDISKY